MCGIWRYSFAMPDSTRKKNARGVALSPYPRSAKIILLQWLVLVYLPGVMKPNPLSEKNWELRFCFEWRTRGHRLMYEKERQINIIRCALRDKKITASHYYTNPNDPGKDRCTQTVHWKMGTFTGLKNHLRRERPRRGRVRNLSCLVTCSSWPFFLFLHAQDSSSIPPLKATTKGT